MELFSRASELSYNTIYIYVFGATCGVPCGSTNTNQY